MSLSNTKRTKFYKIFHRLYGEKADTCIKRLEELLTRNRISIQKDTAPIDQTYAIVIAYGDSIRELDQPPLAPLKQFLFQRLNEIFTAIHILPFFPYSSDDGFSVIDYREVRSELGDWSHIEAIGQQFDLMTDLVINHVSSESRWFKDYLSGKDPFKDYFIEVNPDTDLGSVVRPRTTPLLRRVETRDGAKHVWTTFGPDQIDLNFANPDVLFEFIDILLFYISKGARILRLDAIPYLWKEIGTTCVNLDKTHTILQLLRQIIDIVAPHVLILAESNFSDEDNVAYFGAGAEAHLLYQFALPPLLLHAFHSGSAAYVREWAKSLSAPPPGCTYLNLTASHDGIMLNAIENLIPESEIMALIEAVKESGGLVSYKSKSDGSKAPYELNSTYLDAVGGGDSNAAMRLQKFLCSQTIAMSLKGIPIVYVNSLMAATNDQQDAAQLKHPRAINRFKWNLNDLDELLTDRTSMAHRVFTDYLNRLRIRGEHAAFHPMGKQDILELPDSLLGIVRVSPDRNETIVSIHNISDELQEMDLRDYVVEIPNTIEKDIVFIDKDSIVSDTKIRMAPYASCWAKI